MVSCKKNLLLRFDNFEEGAELTYDRFKCFLFRRYFDSVVRISASVAFQEGSFQMNCLLSGMILFMAHKSLVDWQQLKLFFSYFKTKSSSHFKRVRKLIFKAVLLSLAPTLVVRVAEMFEFSIILLVLV